MIVRDILNETPFSDLLNSKSKTSLELNFDELETLADSRLIQYLPKYPVCNIQIEKFLIQLRKHFLHRILETRNELDIKKSACVLSAMARQCYLTGYLYPISEQEIELLEKLKFALQNSNATEMYLLIFSCYESLNNLVHIKELYNACQDENEHLHPVFKQQILDPEEESLLEVEFSDKPFIDSHNKKIQQQYEENPYPIFESTKGYQLFFHNDFIGSHQQSAWNILIAGCGTGLSAILNARYFNQGFVSAFDISRKSLARAKRIAEHENISNIRFYQQDIRNTNNQQEYDFVECVGVLQHLQDPLNAIELLSTALKPNGYLRISFYSKIGRDWIDATRKKLLDDDTLNQDIVSGREKIKFLKEQDPGKQISRLNDFYSRSEYTDMLFHVYEQAVDLTDIENMITSLELTFLGFEIPDILRFQECDNDYSSVEDRGNFNHWKKFQKKYPETFISQYTLWLQK